MMFIRLEFWESFCIFLCAICSWNMCLLMVGDAVRFRSMNEVRNMEQETIYAHTFVIHCERVCICVSFLRQMVVNGVSNGVGSNIKPYTHKTSYNSNETRNENGKQTLDSRSYAVHRPGPYIFDNNNNNNNHNFLSFTFLMLRR